MRLRTPISDQNSVLMSVLSLQAMKSGPEKRVATRRRGRKRAAARPLHRKPKTLKISDAVRICSIKIAVI